jgi:hypothetical protein
MELAILVTGAIGLIGTIKIFSDLATFEDSRIKSQYRYEEEQHNRLHKLKIHEDPRYYP